MQFICCLELLEMHCTNSIPWQASQLSAWVIYQSAKCSSSCYQALPFTKMAICSKRGYRGLGEQQGVVEKMLDADNCSSSPDFSTKQHMSLSLPKLFLYLCNGKNNVPPLLPCEAQKKIIRVKVHFNFKSAVQIMSYHL